MVKCPLDCFLVYSFLLDVELAKIRHAPFGIFAFSDKPLRNPSEHSGFWYIQGRIFSSCGLSETQGLPRSLVRFRAHRGEQQNIADGGAVGEQHDQAIHTEAQDAELRGAIYEAIGNSSYAAEFSTRNQNFMLGLQAPYAPRNLQTGESYSQQKYNIHHVKPVEDGGDVYNLDNLEIVAPKTHDEIHAEIDEQKKEQNQQKTCKK